MVHNSCIELWMHAGSLENAREEKELVEARPH